MSDRLALASALEAAGIAGDAKPGHPEAVTVASDRLVFTPRLTPVTPTARDDDRDRFLDWPTPDGSNRWELVDGIPRAMAPASDRHAAIQAEAARLIGNHLAERPGYSVMVATGVVIDDYNVRIPDIAVACQREGDIERHPRLLIEVLSPTDAADVSVYMEIATVDEVLVLDSTEVRAEVLRRPTWRREEIGAGSVISLVSIGLTARLAVFYRTVAEPPR